MAFPPEGSATTPPHEQAGFVFRTHQTELFAAVRSAQNIVPQQFFTPMMQLLSIANPGGKSGASFYSTADGSFFFKSVTRPEFKFLESMLPELSERLHRRKTIAPTPAADVEATPGSSAWLRSTTAAEPEPLEAWAAGLDEESRLHYPLGSLRLGDLEAAEAAGKLGAETGVWTEGMGEWQPLESVRGQLLAALAARHERVPEAEPAQPAPPVKLPPTASDDDRTPGGEGSLLPTFMGLYTIAGLGALNQMGGSARLCVMANARPALSPSRAPLSLTFDLKGSTRGRKASAADRSAGLGGCTLKDLDWRELFATPLVMDAVAHARLLGTLDKDVAMLESMGVVDYSLLLGVHIVSAEHSRLLPPPPSALEPGAQTADVPTRTSADAAAFKANLDALRRERLAAADEETVAGAGRRAADASADGVGWVRARAVVRRQAEERLYNLEVSVAIVDVLSSGASAAKVLESRYNRALHASAASVVPPAEYASRFAAFVREHVCERGGGRL